MLLLVLGVVVFCLAHLYPGVMPDSRDRLREQLGENRYRGLLSIAVIVSLVLIVIGWRNAVPQPVYAAPLPANPYTAVVILVGLILFFASQVPGNIKRFVRHPQMTGTVLWGVAHLLTNGDTRSVTLFGGLTLWAVLEIVLINRREGQWQRPDRAASKYDLIAVAIGVAAFILLGYFHESLFGVPARGGPPV